MNRPINLDDSDDEDFIEQLGIDEMNEDQMRQLQQYLVNVLTEEDGDYAEGNDSLFSDLCLDYLRPTPSTSAKEDSSPSFFQSPIRQKSKRRVPLRDVNDAEVELRVDLPALDQYEKMLRSCDVESHDLLNKATSQLVQAYNIINKIDRLANETFTRPHALSRMDEQKTLDSGHEENLPPGGNDGAGSVPPTGILSRIPTSSTNDRETVTMMDKRLRAVLAPAPGKTLFRHDPVTAINMYKEEWKRRPTPEEQKRLSLRWKVRDLMMSRRFMPNHPTGAPVEHPKDWSPKPYLD